jgi:hypothetical protein
LLIFLSLCFSKAKFFLFEIKIFPFRNQNFSFSKAKFFLSFFDRQNLLGFERTQHQISSRLIKGFLSLFSFF